MKKRHLLFIIFIFLFSGSVLATASQNQAINNNQNMNTNQVVSNDLSKMTFYKAKILEITSISPDAKTQAGNSFDYFLYKVKILDKDLKGQEETIMQVNPKESSFKQSYVEGETILVAKNDSGDGQFIIYDHYRMTWIYYLFAAFVVIILLVGKKAGIKALLSLFISVVLVIVLLPLIYRGFDILFLAFASAFINTVLTLLVVGGFKKKTFTAILGTIIGILISFALAYFVGSRSYVTGLSSEEAAMLRFIPNLNISARDLLYAGVILGSLGAVMDVTMSISSAIEEIYTANPNTKIGQLYKSGMNVGKDVMGTMTNTLVLAYLASSLPLLVLIFSYNANMPMFYNMDIIVTEMLRTLAGSLALVIVIPITCILASVMYAKGGKKYEI